MPFCARKTKSQDSTASLLEMESGSNDPMAYMLTFIALGIIYSGESEHIVMRIFLQLVVGSLVGLIFALLTIRLMTKTTLVSEGLDTIFMIAMVLICYALSQILGGNAYLSVYIMGVIIGNSRIKGKATLIPFFDGVTSLAQILIFFLLGLLTIPHEMSDGIPHCNRDHDHSYLDCKTCCRFPAAKTFSLFCAPMSAGLSWAGLRGASSSVFCHYGGGGRRHHAAQPVPHCLYGIAVLGCHTGHAASKSR